MTVVETDALKRMLEEAYVKIAILFYISSEKASHYYSVLCEVAPKNEKNNRWTLYVLKEKEERLEVSQHILREEEEKAHMTCILSSSEEKIHSKEEEADVIFFSSKYTQILLWLHWKSVSISVCSSGEVLDLLVLYLSLSEICL